MGCVQGLYANQPMTAQLLLDPPAQRYSSGSANCLTQLVL